MHLIDDGGFGDAYMGICMPIHMYVYIIYTSEYICIRVQIHKIDVGMLIYHNKHPYESLFIKSEYLHLYTCI